MTSRYECTLFNSFQIPVKSFQSSNHLVKEPMPESENRRQETYFDGEDLAPSGTQVICLITFAMGRLLIRHDIGSERARSFMTPFNL